MAISATSALRETGRITGGPAQGLVAVGDLAFIGTGPRLVVIDIADPAAPAIGDVVYGVRVLDPILCYGPFPSPSESAAWVD